MCLKKQRLLLLVILTIAHPQQSAHGGKKTGTYPIVSCYISSHCKRTKKTNITKKRKKKVMLPYTTHLVLLKNIYPTAVVYAATHFSISLMGFAALAPGLPPPPSLYSSPTGLAPGSPMSLHACVAGPSEDNTKLINPNIRIPPYQIQVARGMYTGAIHHISCVWSR